MRMLDAPRCLLGSAGGGARGAGERDRARGGARAGRRRSAARFDVELRADLGDPTLGWGLDLGYDPRSCSCTGAPDDRPRPGSRRPRPPTATGSPASFPPADGSPATDVLLAIVHFQALALGVTQLAALGDAVRPRARASRSIRTASTRARVFQGAQVQVVPEPRTAVLARLGLLGLPRVALRAAARASAYSSSRSDTTRR